MWARVKVDLVFIVLIMYSSPGKYIHEQNTQFWSDSLVLTQKYALQTSPGKYIHEKTRLVDHNLSAINTVVVLE